MSTNQPSISRTPFAVTFPKNGDRQYDQDEEWCEVTVDGERRRLRFHDYGEIFDIPGLYEHLFHDLLRCKSPQTVGELLVRATAEAGVSPQELRVLDLGAGNGLVGEELADRGVNGLVGIDLLEEAAAAAERDRSGLYDDYLVADLTRLEEDEARRVRRQRLNCLVTVAALGFGDIPPLAFATAWNLIEAPGWLAFNIRSKFLDDSDSSGFSRLVERMMAEGVLEERARRRYPHRNSMAGEPLEYVAIVGRKHADVPLAWAAQSA